MNRRFALIPLFVLLASAGAWGEDEEDEDFVYAFPTPDTPAESGEAPKPEDKGVEEGVIERDDQMDEGTALPDAGTDVPATQGEGAEQSGETGPAQETADASAKAGKDDESAPTEEPVEPHEDEDGRFIPSEQINADTSIAFPVDI